MDSQPPVSPDALRAAQDLLIPDGLMQQLHAANARLHEMKLLLEQVMQDSNFSHQQRVEQAGDQLRAAEKEVEEITQKIHETRKGPGASD